MKWKTICKMIGLSLCIAGAAAGLAGCGGSFSGSASSASADGKMKVTIGTTGLASRWSETNDEAVDTNGLQGFTIDLWKEIGRRNGWDVTFKKGDFAGLWGMMDNDMIDSIGGNISMTPARMEKYDFSEPFYLDNSAIIYKPSLGNPESIEFFKGMKMAVGAPTSSKIVMDEINDSLGLGIEQVGLDTQGDVVPYVLADKAPAGMTDKSVAYLAIHELGADLKVYDPQYRLMGSAAPFKKSDRGKKLCEETSKAIMEMKKDGTLKKLTEKWLYDDLSKMPESFWKPWDQKTIQEQSTKMPK